MAWDPFHKMPSMALQICEQICEQTDHLNIHLIVWILNLAEFV